MEATQVALQSPLKFDATPDSLISAAKERKQCAEEAINQVVSEVNPSNATFANCILPIIEAENERIYNNPPIRFYSEVSPSAEIRNAARDAEKYLSDGMMDLFSRQDFYELVSSVIHNPAEMDDLDPESKVYISKLWYSLMEAGFGIPEESRDHYHEIRKRIEHLKMDINKTLSQKKEGIWLARNDLDGVSDKILDRLRRSETNQYWVDLNSAAYHSVLRQGTNSAVRKLLYLKDAHQCPQNVGLAKELFELRDEVARVLGYSSNAAFKLHTNLISAPEKIMEFLHELQQALVPYIQQSMQELVASKKKYFESNPHEAWDDAGKIFLWDISFYRGLYQQQKFNYDENKLNEYFPLEYTLCAMLDALQSIFKIRFELVDTKTQKSLTWHEDVLMYRVCHADEASGSFIGYLYYDLYTWEGKRNQPVAFSVQKGFYQLDGTHRHSTSALLFPGDKPGNGKPCLLDQLNVLALLHETGHALHNLVSDTQYGLLHGTGVSRDFVEVHATVLEKLLTMPDFLKEISCHYAHLSPEYEKLWREDGNELSKLPEKQLPESLVVVSLQKSKDFSLFRTYGNLALSLFDMVINSPESHEALENTDLAKTYNQIQMDVRLLHGPEAFGESLEWGYAFANSRHLTGDYDAQYYTYLSSRVYALAIFDTITADKSSSGQQWMRFRDIIMKPGGSKPGNELLTDFFGKDLSLREIVQNFGVDRV